MSGGPTGVPAGAAQDRYVHPFPSDSWTPGRTDQGMDFAPKKDGAPILSPGLAQITRTTAPPNWPGGDHGLLLKLLAGDHRGRYIYIYESLTPTASGKVQPGQKIAEGRTGGTGIEIGWADPSGATLSAVHGTTGQKDTPGGTPEGQDMKGWLGSLSQQGGPLISVPSPGSIAGDVAGAAGDAASSVAGGIVSALFGAFAADGARILLYIGLVVGGMVLALGGVSVMMGGSATAPLKAAGKLAGHAPVPVPV